MSFRRTGELRSVFCFSLSFLVYIKFTGVTLYKKKKKKKNRKKKKKKKKHVMHSAQ
ncbi:hypothetical protein HanRHA438_Chr15g0690991 [Helianthus annuus]|nr:hypothetical protein HanRHA438_Chr15g0690991 [Helianthus annuus]